MKSRKEYKTYDLINIAIIGVFIFLTAFSLNLSAQSLPQNIIKNTTPVSPEISSLGVYAMAPPNLANGLPSVAIPLYEIKENGVSYPLNLQYSSSGFRPADEASSAGLGWMVTQGMITRIVKDLPDDNPTVKKKFEDFNNTIPSEFLDVDLYAEFGVECYSKKAKYDLVANRLYNKVYDGKPDEYIFNFNGYSGKFLWIKGKPVFLPHDNDLKISKNGDSFIIDAPDGLRYTFAVAERNYSVVRGGESNQFSAQFFAADCGDGDGPLTYDGSMGYISAWILTKIENRNTKKAINFTYSTYSSQITQASEWNSLTIWGYKFKCLGLGQAGPEPGYLYYNTYGQTDAIQTNVNTLLTEIVSDNYKLQITYKNRIDFPSSKALDRIKIFFKNDLSNPVKEIIFTHEYFGSNNINSWLKLKKIYLKGAGEDREYEFSYENEGDQIVSDKANIKNVDHWGYYNNEINHTLFPKVPQIISMQGQSNVFRFNIDAIPWANRTPNFQYAKFYTLNKVKYPTKGYTKYYYESAGGRGIRLSAAEDFDGSQVQKRYYKYENEAPVVVPPYDLTLIDINSEAPCEFFIDPHVECEQSTMPRRQLTLSGYLKYALDYVDQTNFYQTVVEFIGSMDGKGGRTKYSFIKDGASGKTFMTEQSKYSFGDTVPVESIKTTYNPRILREINYFLDPIYNFKSRHCSFDPVYHYVLADMLSSSYKLTSVWYQEVKTEYVSNVKNPIVKTVENYYREPDPVTGTPYIINPAKTKNVNSNGKSHITEYYFPGEIDPDNNTVKLGVPQMWDPANANYKYIISDPIKTKIFSNEKLIYKNSSVYSYQNSLDRVFKIESIEDVSGSGNETRWYFTYTNDSNIKTVQKDKLPIESFLWGYNSFLPVAFATNAKDTEIFYEGFESGNQNDLGHTGINFFSGDYNLNFNPINSRKYVYSYWYRLNGVWKFSGIKNYFGATTLSDGDAIDDIKVYPEDAKLITYTHKPLIGLTSKVDEKDNTTFFQYDAVGRLSSLADQDKNILNSYIYSFSTVSKEAPLYYNTEIRKTFIRNNCPILDGVQLTANPIEYIVPANAFISSLSYDDVMDLARKDLDKNGQEYANANCSCGVTLKIFDQSVQAKVNSMNISNTITGKTYSLPYGKKEMLLPAGKYTITVQLDTDNIDAFGYISMKGDVIPVCFNNNGSTYYFSADLTTSNGKFVVFELQYGNCQ